MKHFRLVGPGYQGPSRTPGQQSGRPAAILIGDPYAGGHYIRDGVDGLVTALGDTVDEPAGFWVTPAWQFLPSKTGRVERSRTGS